MQFQNLGNRFALGWHKIAHRNGSDHGGKSGGMIRAGFHRGQINLDGTILAGRQDAIKAKAQGGNVSRQRQLNCLSR